MTALQFFAIAPHGQFDQESLEIITAKDGTVMVRILHGGRASAIRIPIDTLQEQVAQLRPVGVAQKAGARVLFSPVPEDTGRPSWADVARAAERLDRPLPGPNDEASGVTPESAATSPGAPATAVPSRVTPGDLASVHRRPA
jgi:hypothetical protein